MKDLDFQTLTREARAIRASGAFYAEVHALIMDAETNAGDTLGPRGDLPYADRWTWDRLALGSLRGALSEPTYHDIRVVNWFARRISI